MPFLLKGGLSEALLHPLAKGLDAISDGRQFHLAVDAGFQLPHLRFDGLGSLLQLAPTATVLLQGHDLF